MRLVQDARVRLVRGFDPFDEPIVTLLIKRAYRFAPGRGVVEAVEPSPWVTEQVDERCKDRPGSILRHDCELSPYKCLTDVIVQGHAVAPGERPTTSCCASVMIGRERKDVLVLGDRVVDGARFSEPEPFVRIPLCWSRAYGGIDSSHADTTAVISVGEMLRWMHPEVHPDAYPRNPIGAGWLIHDDPQLADGTPLPNFEDPRRRLTPERLALRDRRLWSLAPEPQGFGWVHAAWYPRCAFLGVPLVEPPLDDELGMPEVHAGWMPRGFSHVVDRWGPQNGVDLRYFNGAAAGLRMRVRGHEILGLAGFMAEGEVLLRLPGPPGRMRMFLGARELEVEVALHTLLIEPDDRQLTLLWAARARTEACHWSSGADASSLDNSAETVTALLDGEVVPHHHEALP
jgi:hypothetical protein